MHGRQDLLFEDASSFFCSGVLPWRLSIRIVKSNAKATHQLLEFIVVKLLATVHHQKHRGAIVFHPLIIKQSITSSALLSRQMQACWKLVLQQSMLSKMTCLCFKSKKHRSIPTTVLNSKARIKWPGCAGFGRGKASHVGHLKYLLVHWMMCS